MSKNNSYKDSDAKYKETYIDDTEIEVDVDVYESQYTNVKSKKILIISGLIVLALLLFVAVTGIIAGKSETIYPNVKISGIEVGGATIEEATEIIESNNWEEKESQTLIIALPADQKIEISAKAAGAIKSAEETAKTAYAYGRAGNIFSCAFRYIKCMVSGKNIEITVKDLDKEYIENQIKQGINDVNNRIQSEPYVKDLQNAQLMIVKGASSIEMDEEAIEEEIIAALKEGDYSDIDYSSEDNMKAEELDVQSLHEEVYSEVANAKYDKSSDSIIDGAAGVDFDVEEASKLWDEASIGDTVTIPLTVVWPDVSTEDLESKLFANRLGLQQSSYSSSSSNRITNITLATNKINGVVLNPGEEFSYNNTVGQRTAAAGFKEAGAYANGEVVQELGGGICQVSSTLYCAVLYSNLKISARTNHYFPVSYLPDGMDATVSWGSPDFRFVNNTDYPIKIVAYCNSGTKTLTVEIWGTNENNTTVEITRDTVKNYDSTYPTVAIGYTTTTYRNIYQNGTLVSKTKEAVSTYHYHEENIVYPSSSPSSAQETTASQEQSSGTENVDATGETE